MHESLRHNQNSPSLESVEAHRVSSLFNVLEIWPWKLGEVEAM